MGKLKKEIFTIEANRELAPSSWLLTLSGDTSAIAGSGQFVQIALPGKYLRRPISVCDREGGKLTLLYKVVGAGTDQLSKMKTGECLEILTGLGNGFDVSASGMNVLLVGGGMGVAPLYLLAKELLSAGRKVQVVLGFNKDSEICLEEEFRALGVAVTISTADGSRGVKGFVTDAIHTLSEPYDYFYTCGPMVMMKAVCALCPTEGQASLEERMGCGFGICYGCTVATVEGPRRVCADGPVFTKAQLGWGAPQEGGKA
ncbi:MAG: dihydroorotate dehydrogenase electron transfer subunit [Bacteroidales bacterium]|nr:dihydroorotate dehydrogenase electron transfer subunit [Bacteroidales bacterium]